MTLTPEQIAQGWKLHDGSDVCPIKDARTKADILNRNWNLQRHKDTDSEPQAWYWPGIRAYRIIEAHGADAEPARPTPFPRDYSELVWDADGWSQTIIVDGKRPEWLRDDDRCNLFLTPDMDWPGRGFHDQLAIRVRRREPKRETRKGWLLGGENALKVDFDLIDGQPDLTTLKIGEDAL